MIKFHAFFTPSKFLSSIYEQKVTNNPNVELAYARLSVDKNRLFDKAGLFWYEKQGDIMHNRSIRSRKINCIKT
ncbi:MAG: hypothetical protein RCG15_00305 [Candidatus Rickettsia vulgarisii]